MNLYHNNAYNAYIDRTPPEFYIWRAAIKNETLEFK